MIDEPAESAAIPRHEHVFQGDIFLDCGRAIAAWVPFALGHAKFFVKQDLVLKEGG